MASRISLFFTSIILALVVLLFPRWEKPYTEAPIAWDVSGYYLYLPATFIYDDIKKLEFLPGIIEKYQPSHSPDQAFPVENGNMVMKYSAGMAVLYSPFFFAAHIYASISEYPADGFSRPYQIAIQLGGLIAAIIGLIFLRKILIRFFSDYTTAWVVLLIGLGTNFFNYGTFDSANVHVWSFALLSILTYMTILFHEKQKWKYAIGIGLCIGLAALVRPTEVLFFLIPLLWNISDKKSFSNKLNLIKNNLPRILTAILTIGLIGSIQLFYWKYVSGNWLVYSYENQGFSFFNPHFSNVFFSYRKGWLIYTPLMLFALIGFVFFFKKWKEKSSPFLLPTIIFFLINTWIIASWDIWWYGGAFGQRAMIPSYVLLSFPLALVIDWLKNKAWRKLIFTPLVLSCIALNLFQTYQAHWGPWEALAMNKAYYWKIFGSTKNIETDKFLLDTNEHYSGDKKNIKIVFKSNFEEYPDTIGLSKNLARSGKYSLATNASLEYSKGVFIDNSPEIENAKWLSVNGWFAIQDFAPSFWHMPQYVVRFWNGENVVKSSFFRPGRIIYKKNEWVETTVDFKLPKEKFDRIEMFLWRPQKMGSLYADDIEVSVFSE